MAIAAASVWRAKSLFGVSSSLSLPPHPTMSTCGNCDCADKSQCVKKGNSFGVDIVETEKSCYDGVDMAITENDPKCKCGPNCSCTDSRCGH